MEQHTAELNLELSQRETEYRRGDSSNIPAEHYRAVLIRYQPRYQSRYNPIQHEMADLVK